MEPGIYLTALVLAVGVLHLVGKLAESVSHFHAASGKTQPGADKATEHRDDWYMFFHCSDLTGVTKEKAHKKRANSETGSSQGTRQRRDSRPASHRYIT